MLTNSSKDFSQQTSVSPAHSLVCVWGGGGRREPIRTTEKKAWKSVYRVQSAIGRHKSILYVRKFYTSQYILEIILLMQ
jgi:hypothetical protein